MTAPTDVLMVPPMVRRQDAEWFLDNPGSTAASKPIREAVKAALAQGPGSDIDRAVEAAANALWPEFSGVKNPRPGSRSEKHLHRVLEAAAPFLTGPAFQQGREAGRQDARDLAEAIEAWSVCAMNDSDADNTLLAALRAFKSPSVPGVGEAEDSLAAMGPQVEARQWDGTEESIRAIAEWANAAIDPMDDLIVDWVVTEGRIHDVLVGGPDGHRALREGDWLVRCGPGVFFPCLPGLWAALRAAGPQDGQVSVDREDFECLLDTYEQAIDGAFQEGYGLLSCEQGNKAEAADKAFVARLRSVIEEDGNSE